MCIIDWSSDLCSSDLRVLVFSRRDCLTASVALATIVWPSLNGRWSRVSAQQALTEEDLLAAEAFGNVTLLHVTDIHAQVKPLYFREPSVNLGFGEVEGLPPHVTGADLLKMFDLRPGSPEAYALTSVDFAALARAYGTMGCLHRRASRAG